MTSKEIATPCGLAMTELGIRSPVKRGMTSKEIATPLGLAMTNKRSFANAQDDSVDFKNSLTKFKIVVK